MHRFAFANARTISEAAVAASTTVADAMTMTHGAAGYGETSVVKAGGIDLLDLLKEGLLAPAKVVDLKQVPGLDAVVEEEDGGLRIGALATLASLADHPLLRERYAVLAEVLRGSASPQIRNVATLGGNLLQRPRCWYFRA
ncbi:MAG TPA: FAD binding domain-containing protein, partial [Xanthobacteraceae bacterium]|nr:FAD binding domain-containing protein [Xanthobacteraceae bacterium]